MSFEYEWQVLSHMPTPVSADEFLRLAEANGVVDKLELEKAMKSLTEQGADFSNASTLANAPVSNQTLTRWQAGKLLEGRHQRFMLGKYRYLSLLGKGSMGTVYLAEHTMMRRPSTEFSRRKKSHTFMKPGQPNRFYKMLNATCSLPTGQ